jgi:glycosyltransferase involved in cell wall biosynthesis
MRGLEIIGPFRGTTGHDRHTREFTRQLVKRGVPVQLTPLEGWSAALPPESREPWFEELCVPRETDIALHFTMPTLCRPRAAKRNVNYTMFEADMLPREWIARAHDHDRILVPTRCCFDTWRNSGIAEEKLSIVPFGVDGRFFSQPTPPLALLLPDGRAVASFTHRFLNIGELRPRKNHLGLLRTWARGTSRGDDAVLIVKLSASATALQLFQADVFDMQQRLGRSLSDAAPVVFLNQMLTDEQLRSLYASATHYISLSFGEGWDFPMTESAAAGLQLIAPRHSAYREYLGKEEALWIPATLTPAVIEGRAGAEDRRWFDGTSWWRPDEEAAAMTIQAVTANNARTQSPALRIRRDLGWDQAAARLHEVLLAV